MTDEEKIEKGPTTITAVGRKGWRRVRLVCVCGYGVKLPDIEIQNAEKYPEDLINKWDEELIDRQYQPGSFRGLPMAFNDPVRIKSAMRGFYDGEPSFEITGYLGWFDYSPNEM